MVRPAERWQAAQIGKTRAVVLQGNQIGKRFAGEVSLDSGAAAPPKPLPWPLYLDLRDHLDITSFGQEERASWERSETGFTFRCLAGQRHAGFVLDVGQDQLPQLPGLGLSSLYRVMAILSGALLAQSVQTIATLCLWLSYRPVKNGALRILTSLQC